MIVFAGEDLPEGTNGILDRNVLSVVAGEFFRDMERLGKEVTDSSGTVDRRLDHALRDLIMFFSDH